MRSWDGERKSVIKHEFNSVEYAKKRTAKNEKRNVETRADKLEIQCDRSRAIFAPSNDV